MTRMQTISKHATQTYRSQRGHTNYFEVVYHSTAVVTVAWKFPTREVEVTLRSGGWQTATTKTRMNQTANEIGLPYHVYQRTFDWYVDTPGGTIEFSDGMQFTIKPTA